MMQKSPSWMASHAEGQEKQRDNIIQKAKILCFQGHTKSFAIQQGIFFVPCDRTYSEKGPQDSLCKLGWGVGGLMSYEAFTLFQVSHVQIS